MKLIPVLLVFFGVLLIWSAHEDKDPRNVIFEALGVKRRVKDPDPMGVGTKVGTWVQPGVDTSPNTPGQRVVTV